MHHPALPLIALIPLLVAASPVVEGLPLADPAPGGEAELMARLFFTSNLMGETTPCGCAQLPLGGLAQATALVHQARDQVPAVFWFDAGDRLFRQNMALLSTEEAARRVRAMVVTDAGSRGGLDAWGVGRLDLGAGLPWLRKLAQRASFPLLSANLVDEEGASLFQTSLLLERGGVKVGVTSVVPADVRGTGYRALEPRAAAREAVRSLRAQGAELVVVLSNLGLDRRLARASGADLVWGSASREVLPEGGKVGRTRLGQAGSRGRYLGEARWYARGRGRGPHLVTTVVPVRSAGPTDEAVQRLIDEGLRRLDDPSLGVEPTLPSGGDDL